MYYSLDEIFYNFSIIRLLPLICKSFGKRLFCHIVVLATSNALFNLTLQCVLEDSLSSVRNYVRYRGHNYTRVLLLYLKVLK